MNRRLLCRALLGILSICLTLSCSGSDERQAQTCDVGLVFTATSGLGPAEGDAVGVYNNTSLLQNQRVQYSCESNRIPVRLPSDAGTVYALYPYSGASGNNPRDLLLNIPQSQSQSCPGIFDHTRLPMSAVAPVSEACADLHLKPLAALMELNFYNPLSDGSETVTSVTVTPTKNSGFCGSVSIDITDPGAYVSSASSSMAMNLVVSNPTALPKKGPARPEMPGEPFYLVLARQSYRNVTISVHTNSGKVYTMQTNETPIDCVSDDICILDINLATLQVYRVRESGKEPFFVVSDITDTAFEGVIKEDSGDDGYKEMESPAGLDFSRVGYHWGDEPIPEYSQYGKTLQPGGGDDLAAIQAAIDAFPDGGKGAIVLGPGVFHASATIRLNKSGLVIRGSRDSEGKLLTTIVHTSREQQEVIQVGGSSYSSFLDWSRSAAITPEHTPVGAMYVITDNSPAFHPGDRVAVCRYPNMKWIEDLKMTREYGLKFGWFPDAFNTVWRRYVVAVEGDKVYLDNPIVMALDKEYCDGYLVLNVLSGLKSESGVEDIILDCEYDTSIKENDYYSFYTPIDSDENHAHSAVKMVAAEHCWAKNVTARHMYFAAVQFGTYSQHCEARSCSYESPVSLITGSRRYAYSMGGGELHLVKDCKAEKARHSFVTTGDNSGPNVFTQCSDTKTYSASGPHNKWSTGTLYDCLDLRSYRTGVDHPSAGYYVNSSNDRMLSQIDVQDAYTYGSTDDQGWTGANLVLWNCDVDIFVCQNPWVTGTNWAWGCVGAFKHTSRSEEKYKAMQPDYRLQGNVYSTGTHVSLDGFESLYEYQLSKRHAEGITKFIPGFIYNN